MPRPANHNPKRRPQKRGGSGRKRGSNLPAGLPADVEEHGEDLAALEDADGEEINIGDLQKKDIAELNNMAKEMEVRLPIGISAKNAVEGVLHQNLGLRLS